MSNISTLKYFRKINSIFILYNLELKMISIDWLVQCFIWITITNRFKSLLFAEFILIKTMRESIVELNWLCSATSNYPSLFFFSKNIRFWPKILCFHGIFFENFTIWFKINYLELLNLLSSTFWCIDWMI